MYKKKKKKRRRPKHPHNIKGAKYIVTKLTDEMCYRKEKGWIDEKYEQIVVKLSHIYFIQPR